MPLVEQNSEHTEDDYSQPYKPSIPLMGRSKACTEAHANPYKKANIHLLGFIGAVIN